MPRPPWPFSAAVPLALALILAGCGPAPQDAGAGGGTVTVFAAASLTETFTELGKRYQAARPGTEVRFNFGSSATLARQLVQGAPADVFAAAGPAPLDQVVQAGLAREPVVFARNRLRIAVPKGNPARVDDLADLADPRVKVALCAPQVPCGTAAAAALDAAGLKVTPVTLEQDVKATLTKVRLGEVDAALVYATDVRAAGDAVVGVPFPEAERAVNDYPIAALTEAGRGFVDLVLGPAGRAVLTEAGFAEPAAG